jgi:hypothetical protein
MRFFWEILKGRNQLEDLSVCAMILLKRGLKQVERNYGLD